MKRNIAGLKLKYLEYEVEAGREARKGGMEARQVGRQGGKEGEKAWRRLYKHIPYDWRLGRQKA